MKYFGGQRGRKKKMGAATAATTTTNSAHISCWSLTLLIAMEIELCFDLTGFCLASASDLSGCKKKKFRNGC